MLQMIEDYWPPAKRLLGDLKFLERLKKYDRDNVPVRIIDVIRKKYVTDPEFTPANVAKASRCVPRASWLWVCLLSVWLIYACGSSSVRGVPSCRCDSHV